MVTNFICSYDASKSHNAKKYFDSKVSMRQMWCEFLKENPDLKTTSLTRNNKGPVLSFSSFRNIFNTELKEVLEKPGKIHVKRVTVISINSGNK